VQEDTASGIKKNGQDMEQKRHKPWVISFMEENFRRQFSRLMGMSPSQYRAGLRRGKAGPKGACAAPVLGRK
jgi:hypothetical protein